MDVGDNRIWLAVLCLSQTAEDDVMIRPIGSQGNQPPVADKSRLPSSCKLSRAHSQLYRGHYEALTLVVQSTNDSGL